MHRDSECIADKAVGIAGQQPLQEAGRSVDDALHWSYPLPQAQAHAQQQPSKLSVLATALADVTALEPTLLDVSAVADSIAVHVMQLLHHPRYASLYLMAFALSGA